MILSQSSDASAGDSSERPMSRGIETEVKLRVGNLAAMRRKVRALGFVQFEARHFETNALFDFADSRLRMSRCLLRLRQAKQEWVMTFKGPPSDDLRYKSRREIEI